MLCCEQIRNWLLGVPSQVTETFLLDPLFRPVFEKKQEVR